MIFMRKTTEMGSTLDSRDIVPVSCLFSPGTSYYLDSTCLSKLCVCMCVHMYVGMCLFEVEVELEFDALVAL